MKITSGEYKYRKIEVPKGIRPTSEKVREALFSMIGNRIEDTVMLDLFAGSGSIGLEGLSRGAKKCIFNEKERKNYFLLNENIKKCGAEEKSIVYNADFRKCLSQIEEKIDIIYVDPPYASMLYTEVFQLVQNYQLLNENGVVIAEYLYDNNLSVNQENLEIIKKKRYGTIGINIYENR